MVTFYIFQHRKCSTAQEEKNYLKLTETETHNFIEMKLIYAHCY